MTADVTAEMPEPTDPQTEAAMAYEDALDALGSPRDILARALQRATEADDIHDQLSAGYIPADADQLTRHQQSALSLASTLASIAQVAVAIAEAEGLRPIPADPDADVWAPLDGELRDDGPHALACRFTARFDAGQVGVIGGRHHVFVQHHGWVDVTNSIRSEADGNPGRLHVLITGRAVSRYNDQVLCITDGGIGLTLPMDLVTLEADE